MNSPLKKYDNKSSTVYINALDKYALVTFKNSFSNILKSHVYKGRKVVLLCIGTDRATGDCLGPIIGYKLNRLPLSKNVIVYGCLEKPVHAQNLNETVSEINYRYPNALIVAIDACLGTINHISHISLGNGGIKPGAGVKKNLPEVGDIFITGIVNSSALLELSVLQNTRLNVVMQMADIIATGIWINLSR